MIAHTHFQYQQVGTNPVSIDTDTTGKIVITHNPDSKSSITIQPDEVKLLNSGFRCKFHPQNALILHNHPLMEERGLILPHGRGIIDADYKDEVLCQVKNISKKPVTVYPEEIISYGQMVKYATYSDIISTGIFADKTKNLLQQKTTLSAGSDIIFNHGVEFKTLPEKPGLFLETGLYLHIDMVENLLENNKKSSEVTKKIFIGPRSSMPRKWQSVKMHNFFSVFEVFDNGWMDKNFQILLPVEVVSKQEYPKQFSFLQIYSELEVIPIESVSKFEHYEDIYTNSNRSGGFGSTGV